MFYGIDSMGCSFCCGADEIGGFGGGEDFDEVQDQGTVKELTKDIKATLRSLKRRGTSLVYATTMSNQPNAAKVLAELGFYTSKPFKKVDGEGRKMQAWFLPLVEFKG